MDCFETLSGLYGLAGIGGLESSTPAAPYDAQGTTWTGSTDLSDCLVPDTTGAGAFSLEEVPSLDLTDYNHDSASKPAVAAGAFSLEEVPSLDLTDYNHDSASKPAVAVGGVSALEGGCEVALDLLELEEALPDFPEESSSAADADELPVGWDDAMMDMTTPQLNRCIKRRGLSKEQGKLIKACRRRLMNRIYAKTSRQRRIEKQVALADDHVQISLRSKTLNQEVQQLRMANGAIMRRLEAFTAMLVDSGKMTHDEIAVFLEPRDA